MSEIKKFPGQPVLSQILDVIPGSIINAANRKHKSNRYYKRLPLRVHLVSLLYEVFSYCNGLQELCEGLLGESPNAIKMQVYCVLIAQLLMVMIRKKAATKKYFANMITVIRLHLTSYVELLEFIKDTYKAWRKTHNASFAFST